MYRGRGTESERGKEWRPHRFLIKLETEVAINHYYLEKLKLTARMCSACCVCICMSPRRNAADFMPLVWEAVVYYTVAKKLRGLARLLCYTVLRKS